MTQNQQTREPLFNFTEKAPVYLAGIFLVAQILLLYMPRDLFLKFETFGFLQPLGTPDIGFLPHATSLVSHGFFHLQWGHLFFNMGMTIIFGIAVVRGAKLLSASKGAPSRANQAFLRLFLFGVIVGGVFQWGWWALSNAEGLSIASSGASGGASALFAGAAWAIGGRDRMIQFGIGWTFFNVLMAGLQGLFGDLSWEMHIGGYIAGMILAPKLIKPNSTNLSVL